MNNEITLRDVLQEWWRSRIAVLAFVLGFAAAGVAFALVSGKKYEAVIVVSPIVDDVMSGKLGGLGALASQYSGIASLAGLSLGGNNKRDETIAVMQSELLTEKYIRDHDLLPVLFAKDWDAGTGKWKTSDPEKVPTLWKANRFFNKSVRKVTDEKRTGLVYLRIEWKDPVVAALWANDLVTLTNAHLREKAIAESEKNIAYLREEGTKTDSVDVRKAIYSVMEQEINKAMFAREREEYALRIIDPAVPPERPSSFGPAGMGIFGFAAGLILSIIWAVTRQVTGLKSQEKAPVG